MRELENTKIILYKLFVPVCGCQTYMCKRGITLTLISNQLCWEMFNFYLVEYKAPWFPILFPTYSIIERSFTL